MQNQYEYKTFYIPNSFLKPTEYILDEAINDLVEKGWELCSLTNSHPGSTYRFASFIAICRRPKNFTFTTDIKPSNWLTDLERFQSYVRYGNILGIETNIEEINFFDKAGYHYTGLEKTDTVRKLKSAFPAHTFIASSLFDANLRFENFDGCWSTTLFAHTPPATIASALRTLTGALKNNAYCFFTIYIGKEDYVDPIKGMHYYLYTEQTAEGLLENNGLVIQHRGHAQHKKQDQFEIATYSVRLQK